jgi:hypothetical protein
MSFISLACLFTDDLCTLHFASSFSPENFKDQELLQEVVSSCMESEGSSWIQIMMISIPRRLHWLSQTSVCITQASSQWMTTSKSCYSYQFDDRDNVVSSFHALKCSKMDFSDHICALLEILQSSYQECTLGCLCPHITCAFPTIKS